MQARRVRLTLVVTAIRHPDGRREHHIATPGKEPTMNDSGREHEVVEEFEVSGKELVERIRGLFEESNASRVTIRSHKGEELMTVPVSFGLVAGGLIAFTAPVLAAVGALAALVTRVKLEVVRTVEEPEPVAEPETEAATPG